MELIHITRKLRENIEELRFSAPVDYVYNPLIYAEKPHFEYIKKYGQSPKEIILLGMNPGPFGMAQTGVPFGDVPRYGTDGDRGGGGKPERENPKRPVLGFACPAGKPVEKGSGAGHRNDTERRKISSGAFM